MLQYAVSITASAQSCDGILMQLQVLLCRPSSLCQSQVSRRWTTELLRTRKGGGEGAWGPFQRGSWLPSCWLVARYSWTTPLECYVFVQIILLHCGKCSYTLLPFFPIVYRGLGLVVLILKDVSVSCSTQPLWSYFCFVQLVRCIFLTEVSRGSPYLFFIYFFIPDPFNSLQGGVEPGPAGC
jgi:hypothetical protein